MTSDDGELAIRLEGVRFQYAGARAWALDRVDIDVRRGEIVGLVGPNDAGKSTLCLVAAGLAPSVTGGRLEGTATLIDRTTADLTPSDAARRCGVLFQQPLSQLSGTAVTVWEEVAFGPRNLGLPIDDIADRVEGALVLLRIEHLAPRDPGRLSGGQGQLVALASVLALRPAALVLDEPTSQLDPEGTRLVGDAIRRAAEEAGCGVLVVEHKTGLLEAISERVVIIDAGRTTASGATADILGSDELVAAGVEPPPGVRLTRASGKLDAAARSRLDAAIVEVRRG
ncbi:MAG: energy-coupling factor transport system ATP-binding protein [Chloroflexota bacterium]|nr:energy-coupling factor transport system ATP-binding protein [Chloroflexota bacterium]